MTSFSLDCRTDKGHRGIDITVAEGDAIRASASGVVVFAGYTPAEGGSTTISIEHQGGMRTTYLHLAQVKVSQGQVVTQGQELGSSGGSPLHFGMKLADTREFYFNPVTYMATPELPEASSVPAAETGAGPETGQACSDTPVPEAPAAQSSAGSTAAVPVNVSMEPTVAAVSTVPTSEAISESRPGEATGSSATAALGYEGISPILVQASSPNRTAGTRLDGLENLISESAGAGTTTPVISGLLTPFSAGAFSILEKSSDAAPSKKQHSIIAGGASPVRNLLLAALLLMVTAGSGCLGEVSRLKQALAR